VPGISQINPMHSYLESFLQRELSAGLLVARGRFELVTGLLDRCKVGKIREQKQDLSLAKAVDPYVMHAQII
jgi:hypothetical protein